MRYLQYRFHDTRGEAPTRWLNNGTGVSGRDAALRILLVDPWPTSVTINYEDGSAVEYRLEPRQLVSEFNQADFDEYLRQGGP